ncbi:hypothetical protein CcaverHIS631_0608270 [Cutaneotrichosporon cavernicola]|nr:hypothetical protein CcaverHIS631_0608270 [Cutaneotrichosporon cavernicola]
MSTSKNSVAAVSAFGDVPKEGAQGNVQPADAQPTGDEPERVGPVSPLEKVGLPLRDAGRLYDPPHTWPGRNGRASIDSNIHHVMNTMGVQEDGDAYKRLKLVDKFLGPANRVIVDMVEPM